MKDMNKIYTKSLFLALAAGLLSLTSCQQEVEVPFETGRDIEIGCDGGVKTFQVSSPGQWVAFTQEPWITISPANGRGSTKCQVVVDTTLCYEKREGIVSIEDLATNERKDFKVSQDGYAYEIRLKDKEKKIEKFAPWDDRNFDIVVESNIDFTVEIEGKAANWLKCTKKELVLDRGARPRKVGLHFEWKVNSSPDVRVADVTFKPIKEEEMGRHDSFKVIQKAAERIVPNTVAGDSLALLAINRGLGCWTEYNTANPMRLWPNVEVWTEGPNEGRVKYVQFGPFTVKEEIPEEIKYLTVADEISIFGNSNSFLHDLSTGPWIGELTQLRKLTIGAYGLVKLDDAIKNLKNLEFLNLSGNNFQDVPEQLTQENFPKLTALIMNANQRAFIHDLSQTAKKNFGGFADAKPFPKQLLSWDNLDTLRLSVNYLQGEIPDMAEAPKWSAEEVHACDTLPDILIGLPKVLPHTHMFAINLNRLSGKLPDWLLYHPMLDIWAPQSLVFPQEGRDAEGVKAVFTNEPLNLDYYYKEYVNKKFNPNNK